MPVYKEKRGLYRVRVWKNGKKRDWKVRGTLKEAKEFEARRRVQMEAAEPDEIVRTVPTFSDFCVTRYRPYADLRLKPSTWHRVRQYELATLMEFFGDLKLTAITTACVEEFKSHHFKGNRKGAATINGLLTALSAVLTCAKELEVPCAEPKIARIKQRTRRKVVPWTEDELARLYAKTAELAPDILPLVVCLANTGLRKGEALALKWADIDLDVGQINIWPSEEWQPKTCKPRLVPINQTLRRWLSGPRISEVWVFPCPSTGRRYAYWPQLKFDRARKAAGLVGGPHTLRHTYATHLVLQTRDLFLVGRILGHTHTRVTELYADLLPDHLDIAREAVDFAPDVTAAEMQARKKWRMKK